MVVEEFSNAGIVMNRFHFLIIAIGIGSLLVVSLALTGGGAEGGGTDSEVILIGVGGDSQSLGVEGSLWREGLGARTARVGVGGLTKVRKEGSGLLIENGLLYFREITQSTSSATRKLRIDSGYVDLGGYHLGDLNFVAVKEGDNAYQVSLDAEGLQSLVATPFFGIFVEVLDTLGKPANGVEVRRSPTRYAGRDISHPGMPVEGDALVSDGGSPLLLGLDDFQAPDRRVFLRDATSRWYSLNWSGTSSGCTKVDLVEGGSLSIDCSHVPLLRLLSLRMVFEGHDDFYWAHPSAVPFDISGVPLGKGQAVLGRPGGGISKAVAIEDFEIIAGEPCEIRFLDERERFEETGSIDGVLDLSGINERQMAKYGDAISVRLSHEAAHSDSAFKHGLGELFSVGLDYMEKDSSLSSGWRWIANGIPAGEYRVSLFPFGLQTEVLLEPGMAASVHQDVSDLAHSSIRFVNSESGLLEKVNVFQVSLLDAAFGRLGADLVWWECGDDGILNVCSVPGNLLVSCGDEYFGHFMKEIEVFAGSNDVDLEVGEASWIEVTLVNEEGAVSAPVSWWQGIQFLQGGAPVEPLELSFPIDLGAHLPTGHAIELKTCLRGSDAVTIIFPYDERFGLLAPLELSPAEFGNAQPRRALVKVPN